MISGSKGSIETILVAVGGGDIVKAPKVLDEIFAYLGQRPDPRVVVMTVATADDDDTPAKYNSLFRKDPVKHVEMVHVNEREDAFKEASEKKIREADVIYFTGGDQLNVTALLGGSPLDQELHRRLETGVMIAGTSAGAAMMSSSMITSGTSDAPPRVGAVDIAPGMSLVEGAMIDTHFSQRGRHGRLLTAIAHYPQVLGIGIDERTAAVIQDGKIRVLGEGAVTVMDASQMRFSDLAYRNEDEPVAMFGVTVHVLPDGYSFDMKERVPHGQKTNGYAEGRANTK